MKFTDTELLWALDMLGIERYKSLDSHLKINFKASYYSNDYNSILPNNYKI